MTSKLRSVPAVLLGIALAAVAFAGTAAGESRNRALERLVAKGMYSAGDGAQIQRSFAAALHAGIRESDALSLVETCVSGEFDASQTQRVLSVATQLALERLPIEGYVAKVEEGVSKRVDPDRVVQAAERRGLMLNKARLILNGLVLQGASIDDRDELLPDLAAALEAGRTPEEARAIISDALRAGEGPRAIRRKLFP
jgi:hypothetical protein